MKAEDLERAGQLVGAKRGLIQTLDVLDKVGGFDMSIRWSGDIGEMFGRCGPPAVAPVFVEKASPVFASAMEAFRREAERELSETTAALAALGITEE